MQALGSAERVWPAGAPGLTNVTPCGGPGVHRHDDSMLELEGQCGCAVGHVNLNLPFLVITKGSQECSGLREGRDRRAISVLSRRLLAGFRGEEGSADSRWQCLRRRENRLSAFWNTGAKVMVADFKVFPDPWLPWFSKSTF